MRNCLKIMVLSLFLASCTGYDTNNARNMKNDFAGYSSFAWLPKDSASIQNVLFDNGIIGEEIVETVSKELNKKGYTISTTDPDILIQYTIVIEDKEKWISSPTLSPYYYNPSNPYTSPYYYNSGSYYAPYVAPYNSNAYYYNYPGYVYDRGYYANNYPYYSPYGFPNSHGAPIIGNTIQEIEYKEGTLIIDVIDRKQRKLVWRGWSAEALPDPEIYREVLPQEVREIFQPFPSAGATINDLNY